MKLAALLLLAACTSADPARLENVWFDGCREVTVDTECRILASSTSTLTVWLPAREATPTEVLIDGVPRDVAPVRVRDGVRFAIPIAKADPPLLLVVRRPEGEWRLRIAESREPEVIAHVERARGAGDFAKARALLEPMLAHADGAVRAKAIGLSARVALAMGDHQRAMVELEESIRLDRAHGLVWTEMNDRYALSFIKRNEGDYQGARDVVLGVGEVAAAYPTGARWAAYYEGYAAVGTTDLRRALLLLERTMSDADRMNLNAWWSEAARLQVQVLRWLGREEEGRALLADVAARIPSSPACARADALELVGVLLRDDQATLERAELLLGEAIQLYRDVCPKPRRLAHSLVQLGSARLDRGRIAEADALLSASKAAYAQPGAPLLLAQVELEAEIANVRRDPSAEEKYRRLEVHGIFLDAPLIRWKGLLGKGAALERKGRNAAAIVAYQETEELLERLRFNAPLGGGRETFLGDRSESASRLIDLLLRADRVDEAVLAARRSRARALSAIAWPVRLDAAPEQVRRAWYAALSEYQRQRAAPLPAGPEDWGLSADKLARRSEERERRGAAARAVLDEALAGLGSARQRELAPLELGPKELVLIYHPLRSGWIGFAIDRVRTTAHRLADLEPASLLAPLAARLDHHDSVRVLSYGALNLVDFHALPFQGGRPLVASIAVRYGVDAPRSMRASKGTSALVVAPHEELRVSQREAILAEKRLTESGWSVKRLAGAAATQNAIGAALASGRIGLLQYAGHAKFLGRDGWESYLGSDGDELLSIGDILTSTAPDYVVLSGCETAAEAGRGGSGLGLAQAFVIAGGRWVIASARPVKDADASAIVSELYAQNVGPDSDAAALLRSAQLRVREARPEMDWASFRVLVP